MAIIDRFTKVGASKFVSTLDDEEATYLLDALLQERGAVPVEILKGEKGFYAQAHGYPIVNDKSIESGDYTLVARHVPVQGEGE